MWFLARMVFWLGLIIALLPIAPSRQETSASKVGAVDSLSAASAAVSDIRQFCVRHPTPAPLAQKRSLSSYERPKLARNFFISF
jgi:hypothetical protein